MIHRKNSFWSITQTQSRLPGLVILFILLVTGLFIFRDYGISWDEPAQRYIGDTYLQYIRTGNDELMKSFTDKDHGAVFEVILKWIEEVISPRDYRYVPVIRHLCTYLFFLLSVWCGYLLFLRLFRQQWLALLGMLLLVLQPRIFAHAFFNSKDVPFLSAVLISFYAIAIALEGKRSYLYLLAGIACGFATDIRNVGGIVVIAMGLLFLYRLVAGGRGERKTIIIQGLVFLLSFTGMVYLCWPAVWYHPAETLESVYQTTVHYTIWQGSVLFKGAFYPGPVIPRDYVPVWFGITMPLVWLGLGLIGTVLTIVHCFGRAKDMLRTTKGQLLFIALVTFLLPVVLIISLHSVVYDDWRHLYFIYAPFVLLALYAAEWIGKRPIGRKIILVVCMIQGVTVLVFMIGAHPHQQVYFNRLVSHEPEYLRRNFDFEYWGPSYKQGLAYILTHDHRDTIPVVGTRTVVDNLKMFPPGQRQRIVFKDETYQGAYLLTNYRLHPEDFPYEKIYGIRIGNSTLMQIYKVDTAKIARP